MAREIEAWAIFGKHRQKPHLDKIMSAPAECWGLLCDELAASFPKSPPLRIVEMRRLGYSCRKVTITWRNVRK